MPIKKLSPFPNSGVYHYDPEREKEVTKAIEFIKKCAYKGTAIKIELEAQLGRDGGDRRCDMCSGTAEVLCSDCRGDLSECETCDASGYVSCSGCDGTGNSQIAVKRYTEKNCQDFILNNVSDSARNSLIFSKTYRDGSVDTELTFTLPLDQARYAVEFIKAFNKLAEEIGTKIKTHGAGMHIAILNSPTGNYPGGNNLDSRRTANFAYTMTKLLPALFFLASPDHRSRRLNYRNPSITASKYSAISYESGCFEYRVFETCYDRPEAILDNICIIANTLKYYHYRKVTMHFFGRIGNFGFQDLGQGVERFYKSEVNYKALMAGVKVLKPLYKTMADLRKERNFKITLNKIRTKEKIKENIWKSEYITDKENAKKNYDINFKAAEEQYNNILRDPGFSGYRNRTLFISQYPSIDVWMKDSGFISGVLEESERSYINKKKQQELLDVSTTITI